MLNHSLAELAANGVILQVAAQDLKTLLEEAIREVQVTSYKERLEQEDERLLSRKDVCALLNISDSTLWRWQNERYLTPIKIGNKSRYKYSEIKKRMKMEE